MIKNKYWNNKKYYLIGNRWRRTIHSHVTLAHDVWNYYNPNNKIKKYDGYDIHHINENTLDDSIENLEKMTHGKHTELHQQGKTMLKETKDKISKSKMGHEVSEKTKIQISQSLKKKYLNEEFINPMEGKHYKLSKEQLKNRPKKRGYYKKRKE